MNTTLGQIDFKTSTGQKSSLAHYLGQVLLLVNVASKCGLTPQYEGLENLFKKYREMGFTVLAFPANEFGAQEPGTNAEIQEFCKMTYGVDFPVLEKIKVKGEGQHPLYKTLTATLPTATQKSGSSFEEKLAKHGITKTVASDITWNFEKFLVNRKGQAIARFAPDVTPDDEALTTAIENELALK